MTNVEPICKRILVATDFSPSADAALGQAVWIARRSQAAITLVHVLPDLRRLVHNASLEARLDLAQGEGKLFDREVRRSSDAKLHQTIANLDSSGLDITYATLLGEPVVELIYAVQAQECDLVLAGARGSTKWEEYVVGSTAQRLVRMCPAGVGIVNPEHAGTPRVVLAATDFSDVSHKAVRQASWVAQQADAKFHLVHVVDAADVPEDVLSKIPEGSSLRKEINDEAQDRLEAFVKTLPVDRLAIESHLAWGTPWQEIERTARQVSADLIVLGTVGRSGVKGMLIGNTAEKVLNRCKTSILTVKPDDFVSPIGPASWSARPAS